MTRAVLQRERRPYHAGRGVPSVECRAWSARRGHQLGSVVNDCASLTNIGRIWFHWASGAVKSMA